MLSTGNRVCLRLTGAIRSLREPFRQRVIRACRRSGAADTRRPDRIETAATSFFRPVMRIVHVLEETLNPVPAVAGRIVEQSLKDRRPVLRFLGRMGPGRGRL